MTMDTLYLIVEIAMQRVVLPADHVESVIEIDEITPVPLAARHVAGLAALRSRVLTIIDTLAALELGHHAPIPGVAAQAVTVACDGHLYGLLVDRVEDVVALDASVRRVRAPLPAGWARVSRGRIELGGEAVLVIDPLALVAADAPAAAA
jgi:purine-binding chemotaxis protein CheW